MKKWNWSLQAKKHLVLVFHAIFLCLFVTGVSLIYLNSNFGRGLGWIHRESFADTSAFQELLEKDIEMIFQYVNYKDVFETDGELDMEKDMVSVTLNSGKIMIYTLDDMVHYAKSSGYYLDENFEIKGGPSKDKSSDFSAEPMINWKAYAPNEVYKEPGDAYASLEKLSKEVLTLLGEYYQIQHNYIDKPSNLYFRVSYMDDNDQEFIYTNAADKSAEDILSMGRYLCVSGDSILMDTNMSYVPNNISALLEKHRIYDNSNYYIMIGLDTAYPYKDVYWEANYEYEQIRIDYTSGQFLLAISLGGLLVTLYQLACLSGHQTRDRLEIHLHRFDHLPLECNLLLFGVLAGLISPATTVLGRRFVHLIVDSAYWDYSEKLLYSIALYLLFLIEGFYIIRCYKANTLWSNSILQRLHQWTLRFLSGCSFPLRLLVTFIGFWMVNILLLIAMGYLYTYQKMVSFHMLYLIPVFAMICFNLWVFFQLWKHAFEQEKISHALGHMSDGNTSYQIDLGGFSGKELELAKNINNISIGLETALTQQVKSERLKADLITNVSHDIKTPLTSIINYVDLIKREHIPDEKIQRYLDVLDQKSQRLKTLTEDLVEASKASSGNLKLEMANIDFVEMIHQTNGEFAEKFEIRHLSLVPSLPGESILIEADGRRLWRVLENLYNNAFKYAMENSRVYADIFTKEEWVYFTLKNISENPLNIRADELTERFVRGDVARTTEGSGLGLSIAKSLTQLQGGSFELYIDGDLFKAEIGFPIVPDKSMTGASQPDVETRTE